MTILTSIILVAAIVAVALTVAYQVQKGTKTLQEFKDDYYDNEGEDLSQELVNRNLPPAPSKKVLKKKEVTSGDITPQVVEKAAEIAAVVEKVKETKPEFPIDKPKKKRKYYPKKK